MYICAFVSTIQLHATSRRLFISHELQKTHLRHLCLILLVDAAVYLGSLDQLLNPQIFRPSFGPLVQKL